MAKSDKPKVAPKPAEAMLSFDRRDHTAAELEVLLDVAVKLGHRVPQLSGYLGMVGLQESAGSLHPEIRPPSVKDEKGVMTPTRVTASGKVIGNPSSSALGPYQFLNGTFLREIKDHGAELVRDAELDKHNPAAAAQIRKFAAQPELMASMQRYFEQPREARPALLKGMQKTDPEAARLIGAYDEKDPKASELGRLLALRSDFRVATFTAAYFTIGNADSLRDAKVELNPTTLYGMHVTGSVAQVRAMFNDREEQAASLASTSAAARNNPHLYSGKNGDRLSAGESYMQKAKLVSQTHVDNFEREHYGRTFGPQPPIVPQRYTFAGIGSAVGVLRSTVSVAEFVRHRDQQIKDGVVNPANSREVTPAVQAARDSFKPKTESDYRGIKAFLELRMKAKLPEFDPRRPYPPAMQAVMQSYQGQEGLVPTGVPDNATLNSISRDITTFRRLVEVQKVQEAAKVAEPGALDLRNPYGKGRPTPERRAEVEGQVVALRQSLEDQGLLRQPTRHVLVREGGKRVYRTQEMPHSGKVDRELIEVVRRQQLNAGMNPDTVLTTHVRKELKLPAAGAPAAAPAAARKISTAPAGEVAASFQTLALNVSFTPVQAVKYGEVSENVRDLQKFLHHAGYGQIVGTRDGDFRGMTQAGLDAYRAERGIAPAQGLNDPATLAAIRADQARMAVKEQYLLPAQPLELVPGMVNMSTLVMASEAANVDSFASPTSFEAQAAQRLQGSALKHS